MSSFRLRALLLSQLLLTATLSAAAFPTAWPSDLSAARPWVYWFIMDGNLSRAGITADFEAMQRAGIGGVILMEVDVGIPRGPVEFMSPAWRDLFRHAVREAERLGLQITLNAGPGWTGSGGPWVKPEQSMQHLVAAETNLVGPRAFDAVLPQAKPRPPFFGEGALPPALEQARKAFYRDEYVLAFPTPTEDARLADLDEKALYVRAPYSSQPGVKASLAATTPQTGVSASACVPARQVLDLTALLQPGGRLRWEVPAGAWTILRFGRTCTGQNTRPAPLPGLGLESDKFDPRALDAHFDAFVGALLREVGARRPAGRGWTMLHIDSWEMGSQNWTACFRDLFRRRRGYDPLRYLPVLTGRYVESPDVAERFLWDLRFTAQELVVENHAQHLRELGRRHGFGLSIEPYDMNPCADLSLGGVADVPMCEFWSHGYGFESSYSCFEAVSIAHTLGRPIVAAEAFTADDRERWRQYPGSMKAQADWAFCTGINRLVFHRYQHQPALADAPGMTMGPYGVHWERTQTWWDLVPAFHTYVARCQHLLRRGEPVADICYLVPEGAPHVFRAPASALRGMPPDRLGYTFDACAPETLLAKGRVKSGRLTLAPGTNYRLLVLPAVDTMTPRLLRKVRDLVKAGATIVGSPPRRSPSLQDYPACDVELSRIVHELWGETDVSAGSVQRRTLGRGQVVWGLPYVPEGNELYPAYGPTAALLTELGVPPDFEASVPLRYTHRRDGTTHVYFVANPQGEAVSANVQFRASAGRAELWDPVTGATRPLRSPVRSAGRTCLRLGFAPHGSCFVILHAGNATWPPTATSAPDLAATPVLLPLTNAWTVRFQSGRGAPETVSLEALQDWTQHPDAGVRHFSGLATYRTTFGWRPFGSTAGPDARCFLDLGQVQVMAEVIMNGRNLGVVWTPPFRVDATDALKPGENTLEIRVANLWPNRLIADAALPETQRITRTTWNPWKPGDTLLPSGLLGPVTLRAGE